MNHTLHRRSFLGKAALGSFGVLMTGHRAFAQATKTTSNNKINLLVIGVAGRGGENLMGVSTENIVALCDTDDIRLQAAAAKHPRAKTYVDFREALQHQGLDAVVVSTPDHTHAVISVAAMNKGYPIYCEKPLARTVSEVRTVTNLARSKKLVTQLGTQIHAGNNYRRVAELIQSGAIGNVKEVHVWVQVVYGGKVLPKENPPVPSNIHYDLWLGPVEFRPYSPEYIPFKWRNWWAFGGGTLADFGCHYMDLPHWALDLSHPNSIEVVDGPKLDPESVPPWLIVRYQHPARGSRPPVTLTWYQGGKRPPQINDAMYQQWKSGVLFVGDKGQLISNYGNHELLPEENFVNFKRPEPFIKNSIGHHKEWIEAVKGNGKTTCPFDYSGPLSETSLLGNVAFRAGKKLEWDWKNLKATNCPEAAAFVQHKYRKGWAI